MAMPKLTADFKEFLLLLNSSGIEYLLVGGYAVGLYGYIRPTKDIDIWVAVHPANLAKISEALVRFGFSPGSVPNPLFTDSQTNLRMGRPPTMLELLSRISGVEFEACYAKRELLNIDGIDVPVIGFNDLITNKKSSGRTRDLGDVEQLEAGRNKKG